MPTTNSKSITDIEENQITGYIKIYRSLKKHWLWKASRVKSKAEAFLSMVMDANHQTLKEPIGFDLITVKRGQILTSQEKLSIEWGWTRNQVRSFLEMLKEDKMISVETTTKFTIITLCKYESYQESLPTKQQRANNKPTTGQQQQDTNNNDNNYNNDNKEKNREARAQDFYKEVAEFKSEYKPELLRAFYNYWTEANKSGTKMRFELEKTWETDKRLVTWANREKPETKKPETGDFKEGRKILDPNKYH